MLVFTQAAQLSQFVQKLQQQRKTIGFIPTMGALHQGHLELIRASQADGNDFHICSIFVNPKQFNDPSDLEKYPRPIDKDISLLNEVRCSVLFSPSIEEIYPNDWQPFRFDFDGLDQTMEGAHRAGHFEGVAQVVYRLLQLVQPQNLYMGQKDFQQVAIVRSLLIQTQLQTQIQLHRVPTVREPDGLAMSSRNIRLSPKGRSLAPHIYQSLQLISAQMELHSPQECRQNAIQYLHQQQLADIDYLEIVNAHNLRPIQHWQDADSIAACIVVRIDGVRLLDNILLR